MKGEQNAATASAATKGAENTYRYTISIWFTGHKDRVPDATMTVPLTNRTAAQLLRSLANDMPDGSYIRLERAL